MQVTSEADDRVLVISMVGYPPPFHGNRTRAQSLIEEIRSLGYKIHFAGVELSKEEREATAPHVDEWVCDFKASIFRNIATLGAHRLLTSANIRPAVDGEFYPHWLSQARELQQRGRYQRVLVSYVLYSRFLDAFPEAAIRIIDAHDVFSNRRERLASVGISHYWCTLTPEQEAFGLRRATRIIAIQEQEARFFRSLSGTPATFTIGHLQRMNPQPFPDNAAPTIGFIGSDNRINQHAIAWFLKQVWPRVVERVPNANLLIAGKISDHVSPARGIRALGQLPDLAPFYQQCHFAINPVQAGTGLKIKTVEALAHGRCVLTTRVGAEGLPLEECGPLMVCDSARDFADRVVQLLERPDHLRALEHKIAPYIGKMNQQYRENLIACLK
jgi:glycosyltransferase involved in cell wall biosynthesis